MKLFSHVWLFATPWTVTYQASLSMGFSRQEYWSGLPFPSPGDLSDPGIELGCPALEADALTSEPPGKPPQPIKWCLNGLLWEMLFYQLLTNLPTLQFSSFAQSCATPWTAACQASLSIINSWSLPNSCPSSRYCHPIISSSVVPFSSCPQSFPASGSFRMGQLFSSGGQSIGVSVSTSVSPMNIHKVHEFCSGCFMYQISFY